MSDIQRLFALQDVDAALARLEERMKASDESDCAQIASERYEKALRAHRAASAAHAKQEQALKRSEFELASVEESIARLQAKVYGGEVRNPKELSSLEGRLSAEVRKKESLEEAVLAAMEGLERCKAQVDKVDRLLPKIKKEQDAAQAALDRARSAWRDEVAHLQEQRGLIVAEVADRYLKTYESLIPSTNGRPVAKVTNRTCDGCHVGLPTGARVGETLRCPNCGRLLWWPV